MAKPIGAVKKGQMPQLDAAVEAAMAKGEANSAPEFEMPRVSFAPGMTEAPGMIRVHIVSEKHSDGKYKKTWLRDSVVEVDQYTAQVMIEELKCAYPTDEPLNEILSAYELNK